LASRDNPSGRDFDWEAARQRLARAAGDGTQISAEESASILRARAAALARPEVDAAPAVVANIIVFVIGGERYAFEAGLAFEAVPVAAITPLPGTPRFYLGLIGHRGSVFPLVDIRPLLGVERGAALSPNHAVLIIDGGSAIAVAVDAIDGLARIDAASIAVVPEGTARHKCIRGALPDTTTILDPHALLADARLVVNEQPAIQTRLDGGNS
jgi:purine-binding chemotaxis protein CheW